MGTESDVKIDRREKTITNTGIIWDRIDVCHDPFVRDCEEDWKDATRFMVAVSSCKALAMSNDSAKRAVFNVRHDLRRSGQPVRRAVVYPEQFEHDESPVVDSGIWTGFPRSRSHGSQVLHP